MLKVLSVFGTRPEAVKMAPVVTLLSLMPNLESRVCVTAQHRQMLDQVLSLFNITPDYDLNLMTPDQSLTSLTANILSGLDETFKDWQPDWVLVQGDTTTAMAAALWAYYHHIRVGHVEAGLRTGDKWQPFPEEVNRKMVAVAADLHFAPTEKNRRNLLDEGVPAWRIVVTGNPVVDALNIILRQPAPDDIKNRLNDLNIHPSQKRLILVTAHRRENFGKPLESICQALRGLADTYPDTVHILYPVHLNPNVQGTVHRLLDGVANITLLEPVDYLSMVYLIKRSYLVLTDSGGIQEEAATLNIPTLVMREVTERPEGVEAGALKLVGTDTKRIFKEASRLLESNNEYRIMRPGTNPFGDGQSAHRIIQALINYNEEDHS